jgi:hypothetical protein
MGGSTEDVLRKGQDRNNVVIFGEYVIEIAGAGKDFCTGQRMLEGSEKRNTTL